MITLNDIETAALDYSQAREDLGDVVRGLTEQIEALKRAHLDQLRLRVAKAAAARAALARLVEDHPELFAKPRTHVLHGLKVGWVKGKGRLEWDDEAAVIERIRRLWSEDEAQLLIRVIEQPNREALAQLSVAALRQLGVRLVGDEDRVLIKPLDGEVDKLVDALLKDAVDEHEEAA